MVKCINLLGATGSIGTQTIEVCEALQIRIEAMSCGKNIALFAEQIKKVRPRIIAVQEEQDLAILKELLGSAADALEMYYGHEGMKIVATAEAASMVVAAIVGFAGLEPVLAAISQGKDIALANKETLVAGGALVMPLAARKNVKLIPVDSEHSAIWQCLAATTDAKQMKKIFLTASGGPFLGKSLAELKDVDAKRALQHPVWQMGGKISIDSATLMNKGLEIIEATWLFDVSVSEIEVVVHPQGIIHSMVAFQDEAVLAQLGSPDMKIPIQLALTWPERKPTGVESFNPFSPTGKQLTFLEPDEETFRCLALAKQASRLGGTLPCVLNAANEVAVAEFLAGSIGFLDIARKVEECMEKHLKHDFRESFNYEDLQYFDAWARSETRDII